MVSQETQTNKNHPISSTSLHFNPNPLAHHFMDLLGAPNEPNKLSLSLNSDALQTAASFQAYNSLVNYSGVENCNYSFIGQSPFPAFAVSSSVYLKPAQSILEEVIGVGCKHVKISEVKRLFLSGRGVCNELRSELLSNGFVSSDKHDLQIKISKLLSLLEQVEGRYDEYCQNMEETISSFEVIAGEGAAKCYTILALQAMCRHFCNLRNAIVIQINLARKKLSPELPKLGTRLSRLSVFDQEGQCNSGRLTLQQIGLFQGAQRQAWRPIRGLPETSVAILRAWLFEHFLHPYPNDSEKLTLASQTGLSKNQVSNWFINARVRLWKPMIEEIYNDEIADHSSVDSAGDV
ncbi:hypothetical protein RND81_03G238400 [Saponaria officinalis]|uniref:Homeobox domain-containing protein n=1 Tax=Saponaria officinalis TaxID=3572 RepID=A0AAW1MCG8_SAPOF